MKNRKMKMLQGLPFQSFKKFLYLKKPSPFGDEVEMLSLLWCNQIYRCPQGTGCLFCPLHFHPVSLRWGLLTQIPRQEGTALCSGKSQSVGAQVLHPDHDVLEGLKDT